MTLCLTLLQGLRTDCSTKIEKSNFQIFSTTYLDQISLINNFHFFSVNSHHIQMITNQKITVSTCKFCLWAMCYSLLSAQKFLSVLMMEQTPEISEGMVKSSQSRIIFQKKMTETRRGKRDSVLQVSQRMWPLLYKPGFSTGTVKQ